MSRLFVCLWLPDHVRETLETLHRKDQVGARFLPPENWHVTLRFVGDADPNDVAAALDNAHFTSTVVRLGPAVDVGGGAHPVRTCHRRRRAVGRSGPGNARPRGSTDPATVPRTRHDRPPEEAGEHAACTR